MIFIRVDANEKVATGHMMRCLTIAEELKTLGEKVLFIIKDRKGAALLEESFDYLVLTDGKSDVYWELPQMCKLLAASPGALLLLDGYEYTALYMERLRKYAKIITFDDMFSDQFPADLVINYNLYYKKYDYEGRYQKSNTKLLLGGDYVPLRREFTGRKRSFSRQVENILLICGGGDKYKILPDLLESICCRGMQQKYRFLVVAGAMNTGRDALYSYERAWDKIEVHENVKEMAKLLEQADIAVSAASTVLYECCAMTVPTIFFTMAENQEEDAEVFAESGRMLYAGDIRWEREKALMNILNIVEILAEDQNKRKALIEKMKGTVDGKGGERIALEILNLK
ncbi:MAG: UDP-2,4-diacetamido-2,4,6-trideoxy-beta-L-altropyranose hydrolase [Acetivibrio ethanolgignens]